MSDEALEHIQTRIAYIEQAAAQLSDVVFRQHKEIQALEAKLNALYARFSGGQVEEGMPTLDQERPPHY